MSCHQLGPLWRRPLLQQAAEYGRHRSAACLIGAAALEARQASLPQPSLPAKTVMLLAQIQACGQAGS